MMRELKPCPFCGGEAEFETYGGTACAVVCQSCHCGTPTVSLCDVEAVVNRWNRRAERTCRMVSAFDTDELEGIQENISFSPEDTLAYRCEGCGFDFRYERGLYPSYCPNCGTRVVAS